MSLSVDEFSLRMYHIYCIWFELKEEGVVLDPRV